MLLLLSLSRQYSTRQGLYRDTYYSRPLLPRYIIPPTLDAAIRLLFTPRTIYTPNHIMPFPELAQNIQ